MQIELNKSEISLIDKALETWEKDAQSTALMGSMFSAMLCPKEERENQEGRINNQMRKAEQESQSRRVQSVLLRAKLYQALSRGSEHEIEVPTV